MRPAGFRVNSGLFLGPDGLLWATDKQGDYIPMSPLHHVEKGKFYGHLSALVWDQDFTRDNPQVKAAPSRTRHSATR